MYIQQKGVLTKYYKYFRDNYEKDHTGITQLTKITGESLDQLDSELVDFIKSFKQEFR
jgi:5-bromo-4-chloroindolyl phosphate hydrolysis protein